MSKCGCFAGVIVFVPIVFRLISMINYKGCYPWTTIFVLRSRGSKIAAFELLYSAEIVTSLWMMPTLPS